MGASGAITAGAYGVQGLSSAAGAYSQSQAQSAMGGYQKTVSDINAGMATTQAQDAITRGDIAANTANMKTRQVVGSQRANMAAQGIDVNSGSAADVQGSTQAIGALDALTIKNNAWRTAWGYNVQASNYTSQGAFQKQAADTQSGQTLLTGGMSFLKSGMQAVGAYKGTGGSGDFGTINGFDINS